jgi:hypothetical protein
MEPRAFCMVGSALPLSHPALWSCIFQWLLETQKITTLLQMGSCPAVLPNSFSIHMLVGCLESLGKPAKSEFHPIVFYPISFIKSCWISLHRKFKFWGGNDYSFFCSSLKCKYLRFIVTGFWETLLTYGSFVIPKTFFYHGVDAKCNYIVCFLDVWEVASFCCSK